MRYLVGLTVLVLWMGGIVLAQGAVQTACAIIPFYGIYLSVEHLMQLSHLI